MAQNGPPPSLLDYVLEDFNQDRESRTSRALILFQSDRAEETHDWNAFVESKTKEAVVTGFMLHINQVACAILIESQTNIILEVIRILCGRPDCNAKVCLFNEEVVREYPMWQGREAKIISEPDITINNLLPAVFDVHRGLLELGVEARATGDGIKARDLLLGNKPQVLARIPSAERVQALLATDLCTVAEYLDMYDAPVEFTFDSERVWPAENPLEVCSVFCCVSIPCLRRHCSV